jgi:hypothetical protein
MGQFDGRPAAQRKVAVLTRVVTTADTSINTTMFLPTPFLPTIYTVFCRNTSGAQKYLTSTFAINTSPPGIIVTPVGGVLPVAGDIITYYVSE